MNPTSHIIFPTIFLTLIFFSTDVSSHAGQIFQLDMFVNDVITGWQATGFPPYLQTNASTFTNVAGLSFIQPSDLMNVSYQLPVNLSNTISSLRAQDIVVQLLIGGQISRGWAALQANPTQAATKAIELMIQHDIGIEIDNEEGGDSSGIIKFIELIYEEINTRGEDSHHISMDINGTPTSEQVAVINACMKKIDWVNLMVSDPGYNQAYSVEYAYDAGVPVEKMIIGYYAGNDDVSNCNTIGQVTNYGDTAAGLELVERYNTRGLSIWAIGGASYYGCSNDNAPGFVEAMKALGIN